MSKLSYCIFRVKQSIKVVLIPSVVIIDSAEHLALALFLKYTDD
ncbi:MAG: hypothetical protein ACP5QW_06500 [bacterium]